MKEEERLELIKKLKLSISLSAELWNSIIDIPSDRRHEQDGAETNRDIHDIQNRIFSIAMLNGITYEELAI